MRYNSIIFVFLFIDLVVAILYSCDRKTQCGCSKSYVQLNKIFGGEIANISSWGWAVSLQISPTQHFCGGTIISPLYVITAAHCIPDSIYIRQNIMVVVGIDLLLASKFSTTQVRSIARVILHPQYDRSSHVNDIAVLRLNQSLNISYEASTARICLPHIIPRETTNNYPIPDSTLAAIGWGQLTSDDISISNYQLLEQVTLNTISSKHRMCQSIINDPQLQFCAGVISDRKGTCDGDSGGPIMYFEPNNRQWILVGIISYKNDCGLSNSATVYTRVSAYYDWLRSIVTDDFSELLINGTNSDWTNSTRRFVSSYYLLLLSLLLQLLACGLYITT